VLRTILAEHELLLSGTVLNELTRILIDKIRVPEPTVREIAVFLRASASLAVTPSNLPSIAVRDPDDAVILGEALASGAAVLVTGDKDLLETQEVPGITILDPRAFWELVRQQRTSDR
jgi:putative PIN family toxin of toxin-antitoxin system